MNTAKNVKCITCLIKALGLVKCVKKIEMCVIVGAIILVGIGTLSDNRKEIGKIVKAVKKKVM